jgi:hypothetical protein
MIYVEVWVGGACDNGPKTSKAIQLENYFALTIRVALRL